MPSQPVVRRPTFCRGPVFGARCGNGAPRKQRPRRKAAAEQPAVQERPLVLPPPPELSDAAHQSAALAPAGSGLSASPVAAVADAPVCRGGHETAGEVSDAWAGEPPVLSALPVERHTPANDLRPANLDRPVELPTAPGWLRSPAEPPPVPKRAERAYPPISTARPRKPGAAVEPLTLPGKLVSAEEYGAAPPPPLAAALPLGADARPLRVAPPPPRINPLPPLRMAARDDELLDGLADPQELFNMTTHRDLGRHSQQVRVRPMPPIAHDDEEDLRETLRQPRPAVRISA